MDGEIRMVDEWIGKWVDGWMIRSAYWWVQG
jgi:hypothetical protein